MITVRIPNDENFNYKENKKLYKKFQRIMEDDQPFREVVKNTFYYSFYNDETLIGAIYCFYRDDKLFLNAFATRHHHNENIECFKKVLSWFNCDMYAESNKKTAIYCLLKCGFKKLKDNIFIYRR